MATTDAADALLTLCIQDLHAGAAKFAKRYPAVAEQAKDAELVRLLRLMLEQASEHGVQLAALADVASASTNLWMRGILKDARRDTGENAPGALLDTAIIGSARKALAASIVSYDTAIALAGKLGRADAETALKACHAGYVALDRSLAERLAAIAAEAAA